MPLSRALGREAGLIYARLHREHGVQLHTGVAVARVEGEGRVERVVLADGRALDADLLVCGLGAIPRTELAQRGGLAVENCVICDASLQTSDPHVFAAGDIANAEHPFYGRRVRVEHWANALNQPEVAAKAMLGKPAAYDKLPYFFSDQYDAGMEYRGLAVGADAFEIDGDAEAYEFVAYWRREGRTIAAMNVNMWDVGDQLEEEILSRAI